MGEPEINQSLRQMAKTRRDKSEEPIGQDRTDGRKQNGKNWSMVDEMEISSGDEEATLEDWRRCGQTGERPETHPREQDGRNGQGRERALAKQTAFKLMMLPQMTCS